MNLLDAVYDILKASDHPMSAKDLAKILLEDGIWKSHKAIVCTNGVHTKTKGRIYDNGWKT